MTPETPQPNIDLWARPKVTIHLSAKRKARLSGIAATCSGAISPIEAIERAIEMASRAASGDHGLHESDDQSDLLDRVETLETMLGQLVAERRADSDRLEASINEAAINTRTILDLISAASNPPHDGDEFEDHAGLTLRSWIQSELARLKITLKRSAIVRAQWNGMNKASSRMATLGFDVTMAAVDESPIDPRVCPPANIEFGLAEIDSDLFRAVASKASLPLYMVMAPNENGRWQCTIFASKADGSMAEKMAACII